MTTATLSLEGQKHLDRYCAAGRLAGCPIDQMRNFLAAGIVLQPVQLRASAAARECDHAGGPVEVGYGGARGGGKSFWGLAQLAADDCQRAPGLKCLFLRKVGKAAKESFDDMRVKLLHRLPHRYNRQQGTVTFENGSRIVIGHFQNESDIDAYLGLEYDVILAEEATTLTPAKQKAIATCNRTSRSEWRPRRYNTTNPGGVSHTYYKRRFVAPWKLGRETDTRFVPATVDDNRFVNPEYRGQLETLTGWQKRAWLYGDWDIAAGQFFTTFRQDVHVIKPFDAPAGWRKWLAMDYGFTHLTAVYLLAESGDRDLYYLDEHAERGWLPERHAEAIRRMLERNHVRPHEIQRFVAGADVFARRETGRCVADSYREQGFQLKAANDDRISGAAEILHRLGDVEAGIRPRLFISEKCARLAECLPAMEHDPHRPEDVLKVDIDEDGIGGDDAYDSARYGCIEAARPIGRAVAGPASPFAAAAGGAR